VDRPAAVTNARIDRIGSAASREPHPTGTAKASPALTTMAEFSVRRVEAERALITSGSGTSGDGRFYLKRAEAPSRLFPGQQLTIGLARQGPGGERQVGRLLAVDGRPLASPETVTLQAATTADAAARDPVMLGGQTAYEAELHQADGGRLARNLLVRLAPAMDSAAAAGALRGRAVTMTASAGLASAGSAGGGTAVEVGGYRFVLVKAALGLPSGHPVDLFPVSPNLSAEIGEDGLAVERLVATAVGAGGGGPEPLDRPRLPADTRLAAALLRLARTLDVTIEADETGRPGAPSGEPWADPARRLAGSAMATSEGWRGVLATLAGAGGESVTLGLWRDRQERDGERGEPGRQPFRIGITLELSRLGRARLDLLVMASRCDAILTCADPVAAADRIHVGDLFGAGLELAGLEGSIVFRVDRRQAAPPIERRDSDGLVV